LKKLDDIALWFKSVVEKTLVRAPGEVDIPSDFRMKKKRRLRV